MKPTIADIAADLIATNNAIPTNYGLHVTYPNGLTVSIQCGPHHYCSNRWEIETPDDSWDTWMTNATTAEVAILKDDHIIRLPEMPTDDDVLGYLNAENIAYVLEYVKERSA